LFVHPVITITHPEIFLLYMTSCTRHLWLFIDGFQNNFYQFENSQQIFGIVHILSKYMQLILRSVCLSETYDFQMLSGVYIDIHHYCFV
jgi:hypothetical protein